MYKNKKKDEFIQKLISGNLKGVNQKGNRVSLGEGKIGTVLNIFENENGRFETKKGISFSKEEIEANTVALPSNKEPEITSINDLPEKTKILLTLLIDLEDKNLSLNNLKKIINAQMIVDVIGGPVTKEQHPTIYKHIIKTFGRKFDRNKDGIIGNNLKPQSK